MRKNLLQTHPELSKYASSSQIAQIVRNREPQSVVNSIISTDRQKELKRDPIDLSNQNQLKKSGSPMPDLSPTIDYYPITNKRSYKSYKGFTSFCD